MASRGRFSDVENTLRFTWDAVHIFIGAYLMTRYTAYFTTREQPEKPLDISQKEPAIAFGVAAVLCVLFLARRNAMSNIAPVVLTASMAGAGTLCALMGVPFIKAGLLCGLFAAVTTVQFVVSFPGIVGGIAGAIATGNMIGTMNRATGTIAGVFIGLLVTAVAMLFAMLVGIFVAMTMAAILGESSRRPLGLLVIGVPTAVCVGVAAGSVVWLCDGFVLDLIDELKELPNGFVIGTICGIVIGFVLGTNVGYSSCFEQYFQNRQVFLVYVQEEEEEDKKKKKKNTKSKKED